MSLRLAPEAQKQCCLRDDLFVSALLTLTIYFDAETLQVVLV
jgi:hypothetical protein